MQNSKNKAIDDLRYQESPSKPLDLQGELAHIKLRYKPISKNKSVKLEKIVKVDHEVDIKSQSEDMRFAIAVIGFAEALRNSQYAENVSFTQIIELANSAKGQDLFGYRSEFVQLVRTASALQPDGLLTNLTSNKSPLQD